MDNKLFALFGVAAALLFFGALIVAANMTPDYSHMEDSVNLLLIGGDNRAVGYSVFGFIMPGLLLVGFGAGLHRWLKANGLATNAALLTMLWGGFLAVAGIVTPQDFDNLGSREIIHSGSVLLSALFFLTAAGLFAAQLWGHSEVRIHVYVTIVLCVIFTAVFFAGAGNLGTGLAQRIGFAAQFVWVLIVATLLWGAPATRAAENPPEDTAG